jgi:serine/threonine protein kinase
MSDPKTCARCGTALESGDELCPRCLLTLGRAKAAANADAGASTSARRAKKRAVPALDEIARRFPELEVLAFVGEGGMGAVYKARQPKIDRFVALKVLALDPSEDPTFAERFRREAMVLARLDHPNVVKLYDFGERDGLFFLVLEFVDGNNLRSLMKHSLLEPKQALAIVPQICEALQFAHDEGIVHRDIKPENVLIDAKGRVKIADFGLAKILDADARDVSLTEVGQVMGTPHYMAPEQLRGAHDVDHRADIYSLGVVFYEMLTGELPRGNFELPSKRVHVDVRLDEIVLKSLERAPERRYQHAIEVKTDVESMGGEAVRPDFAGVHFGIVRLSTRSEERTGSNPRGRKDRRVVVIPGRPREGFVLYLLLWPLVGLAFNAGAWWFTAAMTLVALTFWSLMKGEITTQPELQSALAAESHGMRFVRRSTAAMLLVLGCLALYCAHIALFPDMAHRYRSGPSDPDLMHALQSRLLPLLESRMSSAMPDLGKIEFVPEQFWALDHERLWNQSWLAIFAPLSCAAAAFALTARRAQLAHWRGWIPTVRSTASLFGALLVVHAACAVVAALRIEGGPLEPVLGGGSHAAPAAEHGTEDLARRVRLALVERKYVITATGAWSLHEGDSALPPQQLQILFADHESPFDRWHLSWSGPERILPHAVFVLRGPRDDSPCSLACYLGDVLRDAPERREWSEWFSTLLH